MSEQNKLGTSKHNTCRNCLRYWKQNYEVQITQPFCEVSYLSHREPKAVCAARLTPDSLGLGPGGGRGCGGEEGPPAVRSMAHESISKRATNSFAQPWTPANHLCWLHSYWLMAFLPTQERIQSTSA